MMPDVSRKTEVEGEAVRLSYILVDFDAVEAATRAIMNSGKATGPKDV